MKFLEWYNSLEILDQPLFTSTGERMIVYSTNPALWNLDDFWVTSQNSTVVCLRSKST